MMDVKGQQLQLLQSFRESSILFHKATCSQIHWAQSKFTDLDPLLNIVTLQCLHTHICHFRMLNPLCCFFYKPRPPDSTLLNNNQCLVKTEARPINRSIKQKVNNATTALWLLIPLIWSFLLSPNSPVSFLWCFMNTPSDQKGKPNLLSQWETVQQWQSEEGNMWLAL